MARKALLQKALKKPKYSSRIIRRCKVCGRPKAFIRKYSLCRICFREFASKGEIPGVTKSSW